MLQDDYMGVAVFAIVAILFPTLAFFLSRYFRTDRNDSRSMTVLVLGSKTCNPCMSHPMAGNRGNRNAVKPAHSAKPLDKAR